MMKESARLLKKGGKLIIVEWDTEVDIPMPLDIPVQPLATDGGQGSVVDSLNPISTGTASLN